MLEAAARLPVDALVEVGKLLRADGRADLIDLGVGVYRNEHGRTDVPGVVKTAERYLVENQSTKAYVAPDGDPEFNARVATMLLGEGARGGSVVCAQAPGGTGALRLAMDLIAHASPGATVHLGVPSWPNHAPMLAAAGLRVEVYDYYDLERNALAFDATIAALQAARRGDVVLLHGCCHNPSGADPERAQWEQIVEIMAARGLVPLVDMAYQGLGEGLDEDAAAIRMIVERLPEALVAASCSKSFSLYRERVGMLLVKTDGDKAAELARSNIQSLARLNYSNPPDHGAAIVRTILGDAEQSRLWREGLDGMRLRIKDVRRRLAGASGGAFDLSFIGKQKGLFALLPIGAEDVEALRRDHGIYMARSGRINLASSRALRTQAW
ncbi:aromatic amino acid transaminase [Sphingopyxis sp. KK2]|uniref:aromatic amino acid transaminase n=1 Tax=Sphingopyxis sp. KK2 TaxID=1855727 RepID=UPI00097E5E30|nr:aromatic amino acid transaminase [Sphingopyxis sp. KK2]